ncbi:ABC transporter ATP-binding protein [Arthrobacter sp. TB 23]|uniref:ABC transporter ATP-binding protein n=1 Tax=Arthrobacter sp. TB 23 TaxID=494419 RepID=UPI0002D49FB4|nr:ABC transporter ATP-binding protein [Arthrobacter sp. TB 23]
MGQVIEVKGLRKSFGRRDVLHGIDFGVERGEVFGVIGPNGAGKTTTMRCLLDIIRPSAGSIRILGENPGAAGPKLRRKIGYLPGELFLEQRITGRWLLAHYAAISGAVRPGRADELAERFNLDLDRHTRKLSKGNKQKLGLVQAFMHDPEVLILDEPTSGLDPLMQQEFRALPREAQQRGQTIFLSSHVLSEVQQAADRVAILRDGDIVQVSSVSVLREGAHRQIRIAVTGVPGPELELLLRHVPGLHTIEVQTAGELTEISATHEGAIRPLIRALAPLQLADLVIEEPDLEESVLTLYGTGRNDGTGRNGGTGGTGAASAAGASGRRGDVAGPRGFSERSRS